MKITDVKVRKLAGTMEVDGPFMEERLVQPIDVYEEYRVRGPRELFGRQVDDKHYRVEATYVQIDTDEGVSGMCMTGGGASNYVILTELKPIILGKDPFATEMLWDQMHRISVHGRQGTPMMAISVVDNALWDLKGKALNTPVYRLIGGPTREEMPAYASMLGYATQDMGLVRERAQEFKDRGFTAQKWFFRHGPMGGPEGMKLNVELVKTLREALGDDIDIMLDCWQAWDANYTIRVAEQIEEYHPRWLEECAMPDRIDTYRRIREKTNIPLSGAEHEYTRWGFKRFIDAGALDIIQPDLSWAGGISEVLKIAAYASTYDLITIPHQGVTPAGMAFSASQSPIHTPYVEMLIKFTQLGYFFAKESVNEKNGMVRPSGNPGLGVELDPAKIEKEEEVRF